MKRRPIQTKIPSVKNISFAFYWKHNRNHNVGATPTKPVASKSKRTKKNFSMQWIMPFTWKRWAQSSALKISHLIHFTYMHAYRCTYVRLENQAFILVKPTDMHMGIFAKTISSNNESGTGFSFTNCTSQSVRKFGIRQKEDSSFAFTSFRFDDVNWCAIGKLNTTTSTRKKWCKSSLPFCDALFYHQSAKLMRRALNSRLLFFPLDFVQL